MNILSELRSRFRAALVPVVDDPSPLLQMIRPAQDPRHGDYQANCAMSLGKQLGRPPREVALEIVERLDVHGFCHPPEVAGPGFINLRLKDEWLAEQAGQAAARERLGIPAVAQPRTYVLDFSSPNVAKPMHVGHIRSTVIGDALCRILRFLGHRVISDNHLGDWGTQFGMIIYGYRHFVDQQQFAEHPVRELARLYKLVNQLVEYHEIRAGLPALEQRLADQRRVVAEQKSDVKGASDPAERKRLEKHLRKCQAQLDGLATDLAAKRAKLDVVDHDARLAPLATAHSDISDAVLAETARLHEGDPENRRLWHDFLPRCREDIQRIYDRLRIRFDCEHGESFYEDQLGAVVDDLVRHNLATNSEGALCVFLESFDSPMIVRKRDGAYLYATTDLATIRYRMDTWQPDAILYVVDHRQSEHFAKLFAAARLWGYRDVELQHISFGTVLGEDGRPLKTRSGENVELESLLNEAVARASAIVAREDDSTGGRDLTPDQQKQVAETVGIGALKYADLSQNRTSDYVFSFDKMLALNGNTATYMQYAYARVQSIFARGNVNIETLRSVEHPVSITHSAERALALELLRFSEALDESILDYRPNLLTAYLYEKLAKSYSTFFENCPVLRAESDEQRNSRLRLCDLTARTIKQGLALLGIDVVERM